MEVSHWKLLYYVYVDLAGRRDGVCAALSASNGVSGRVRVGFDGINASLGGARAALDSHALAVSLLPEVASAGIRIDFKFAPLRATRAETDAAFPRAFFETYEVLKVEEIVTLGPVGRSLTGVTAARHASPIEFHAMLTGATPNPAGSIILDVRNQYESAIGTLDPSPESGLTLMRPAVRRFEDMPAWVEAHAEELAAAPRISMFCTGGVRCERFSALVRSRFPAADVLQLEGGIQRYMEAAEDRTIDSSRWRGRLYVFDERPAVRIAGANADEKTSPHLPGVMGTCVRCIAPWDDYRWSRCATCRVLVLECDACRSKNVDSPLSCAACTAGEVLPQRARTRARGRKVRLPRPDLKPQRELEVPEVRAINSSDSDDCVGSGVLNDLFS